MLFHIFGHLMALNEHGIHINRQQHKNISVPVYFFKAWPDESALFCSEQISDIKEIKNKQT